MLRNSYVNTGFACEESDYSCLGVTFIQASMPHIYLKCKCNAENAENMFMN